MVIGMMSVAFATVDPDAPAAETHTYTITMHDAMARGQTFEQSSELYHGPPD